MHDSLQTSTALPIPTCTTRGRSLRTLACSPTLAPRAQWRCVSSKFLCKPWHVSQLVLNGCCVSRGHDFWLAKNTAPNKLLGPNNDMYNSRSVSTNSGMFTNFGSAGSMAVRQQQFLCKPSHVSPLVLKWVICIRRS